MNAATFHCANAACQVAATGKCLEGLALDRCPHITPPSGASVPQASDESPAAATANEAVAEGFALPAGQRLAAAEASAVLRSAPARVVAIIGPTGAGKTSLIASLYDLFQNGPVGAFHFTRSRTLYAFEQACHEARAASQRATPHTVRTPLGDVAFYHLGLQDDKTCTSLDLLLSDRAGEEYRTATDDPTIAAGFVEARRADVITLLVDGHRLLDLGARHNLRSEVQMILQALVDGDAVTRAQRAVLVLTKLDAVATSPHKDRALRDYESLVQTVGRLFPGSFCEIAALQVAASPVPDSLPRGLGLADLLQFWMASPPPAVQVPLVWPRGQRAMARLAMRAGRNRETR